LRDLAGLIVIDFIDMDEGRNNRTVERRLKEALKHDRARIQVGRISHFGLLEMSRQRIRTSVLESSTEKCPVCGGSGHVRSVSSVALQCLRAVEEMLIKGATHNLIVRTRAEVALYVLNHKRAHLRDLEERFRITLTVAADPAVTGQQSYIIDRGEQVHSAEAARHLAQAVQNAMPLEEAVTETDAEIEVIDVADAEAGEPRSDGEHEGGRRRRRRRGRGRGGESRENGRSPTHETVAEHAVAHEDHDAGSPEEDGYEREQPEEFVASDAENGEARDGRRRRRRGRRGGRRNRRGREDEAPQHQNGDHAPDYAHAADADQVEPIAGEENGHDHMPAEPAYAPEPEPPMTSPTAEAEFPPPIEAAPQPTESEPPRRRSTIREPAPFSAEGQSEPPPSPTLPPPRPVISLNSEDEPAQPKRGWWGRRLLGDKG
jgi:ribonuclease E